MAKAILEYDLTNPDDVIEYNRVNKVLDLALAIWDIDSFLRSKIKYAPDDISQEKYEAYNEVREELYEILNKHSINMDNILK